jgi:molybdenum cofactor guanylyltransferase
MGRDKALLACEEHLLVEDVAARVREAAGNVVLVGRPERYGGLGLECLPDLRAGLGPLAGIEAALEAGRAELNLIAACDMPGVETGWLRQLMRRAEETDALCVVARDAKGIVHPLCAVYRSGCLAVVQRALDEGRRRAQDVIRELRADFVDIGAVLENVNTPQEWTTWQRRGHIGGADGG